MIARALLALAAAAVLAAGVYALSRLVSVSPPVLSPHAAVATEWFYADGIVRSAEASGTAALPGIASLAGDWIVLLNLARVPAIATATFYFEALEPRRTSVVVPGHGRRRIVVHDLPALVPPDARYGVRITSTAPLIPQPTRGEYAPGDPVTEAMASFIAYPGPLGARETRWAYADGLILDSSDPLEEREWIAVLNPHRGRDARAVVTLLFNDGRRTHALDVPAERVRSLDLAALAEVPKNVPFGVVVDSDVPVVVEQVRRAYRKGSPTTVSMFACLAHPIGGAADDPTGARDADGDSTAAPGPPPAAAAPGER